MKSSKSVGFAGIALVGALSSVAVAAPVNVTLPGTQVTDHWAAFNATLYPGRGTFPGFASWPPLPSIAPAGGTTGDATIARLAGGSGGGPYPASGSIYFGSFASGGLGGTLGVQDTTAIAGLKTVVVQIDIGPAGTSDFYNNQLPQLNYNGGSQLLAANVTQIVSQVDTGTTFTPPGETVPQPIYRNTWLLQWDLSAIAEPVTSFSAVFSAYEHQQLYAVRLDQGTSFEAVAVPEPGAVSAVLAAGLLGLRRRR